LRQTCVRARYEVCCRHDMVQAAPAATEGGPRGLDPGSAAMGWPCEGRWIEPTFATGARANCVHPDGVSPSGQAGADRLHPDTSRPDGSTGTAPSARASSARTDATFASSAPGCPSSGARTDATGAAPDRRASCARALRTCAASARRRRTSGARATPA